MNDCLILKFSTPAKYHNDEIDKIHSKIIEQMKTGVVVLPAGVEVARIYKKGENLHGDL